MIKFLCKNTEMTTMIEWVESINHDLSGVTKDHGLESYFQAFLDECEDFKNIPIIFQILLKENWCQKNGGEENYCSSFLGREENFFQKTLMEENRMNNRGGGGGGGGGAE